MRTPVAALNRAVPLGLGLVLAACGSVTPIGTTGHAGAGGSTGSGGASGAGGSTGSGGAGGVTGSGGVGGVTGGAGASAGRDGGAGTGGASPGSVMLQLDVPANQFCDPSSACSPAVHITIRTTTGADLPTTPPGCSTTCAECQPVACSALCAVFPAIALSGAGLQWDGSIYPMSTCGTSVACTDRQFVAPGRYIAHMCATPGHLDRPDGGPGLCLATGAEECVDVPFDLPGQSTVTGTLVGPGADGGVVTIACEDPTVVHVSDGPDTSLGDTGFDQCADGAYRRRAAMTCPLGPSAATSPCAADDGQCASDADCTMSPHGFCANSHHLLGYCGCFYGCFKDADCGPGAICWCGTPVGMCVAATCVDGSSCPAGSACVASSAGCSGGMSGFSCAKSADECLGDKDCGNGAHCVPGTDHRACLPMCILPP